ncbi:hypothetical protein DERP_006431 [Dermatophagoides pteronyssinus]|uniref:F-box domain-containing protein n=1 Tax=Dermatophagoides pteronyssinus TaxID=6956 RepID=A0ABQ8IQU2_DERPT|nr:hypothetical protein DERP_006431 [Dermatophagoides pteronyssinus]
MALRLIKPEDFNDYSGRKNINDILVEDMLMEIFHYFSLRDIFPMRRVCRYWYELINKNLLKNRKELIICLVSYSTNKYFKREDIHECYYVKNFIKLIPLAPYHENLQILKVFNFMIGDWFQTNFLIHIKQLRSLTIAECTLSTTSFFRSLKYLTKLELINMGIDDEIVRQITFYLPQLEYLNLSKNSLISGKYMDRLPVTMKVLILTFCSLDIHNLYECIESLSKKGCQLEVLNLKYNYIGEEYDNTFSKYLKHLKEIKFSTKHIVKDSTNETFENLEKLVIFEMFGRGNEPLVSDSFFQSFFCVPFIRLKKLHLTSLTSKISDEIFAHCLTMCENIESLKLISICTLTNQSLRLISNLKLLKFLKLDKIQIDTDTAMKIIQQCSNLHTIIIDFNDTNNGGPSNSAFGLNERFIFDCIEFFQQHSERKLNIHIFRSLMPINHKQLTCIPNNLNIQILKSKYILHGPPMYDDHIDLGVHY